jgi:carboxylesterase type B
MLRRHFLHASPGALVAGFGAPDSGRSSASAAAQAGPVVRTQWGDMRRGVANGVNAFKGIPYAAPPFGANRLRPAQPVEPWSGVRDALAFGPKPLQAQYPPMVADLLPELVGTGEDRLTLNIWSKDLESTRQPVMVWIPGGMYEYHGTGACPWYDGSRFARDGVDPGWPKYDLRRRATMHFDTISQIVDDPLARERALWEDVR